MDNENKQKIKFLKADITRKQRLIKKQINKSKIEELQNLIEKDRTEINILKDNFKIFTEKEINHLEDIANWFLKLPKTANVDLIRMVTKTKKEHFEGLHCCFGGWLNLYYGNERTKFWHGTRELSKKLGFKCFFHKKEKGKPNKLNLIGYLINNKRIWGNRHAFEITFDTRAWNEGENIYTKENITTKAIAEKLSAVASRIRQSQTL